MIKSYEGHFVNKCRSFFPLLTLQKLFFRFQEKLEEQI